MRVKIRDYLLLSVTIAISSPPNPLSCYSWSAPCIYVDNARYSERHSNHVFQLECACTCLPVLSCPDPTDPLSIAAHPCLLTMPHHLINLTILNILTFLQCLESIHVNCCGSKLKYTSVDDSVLYLHVFIIWAIVNKKNYCTHVKI